MNYTPDLTEVYVKLKQIHYALELVIDDLHESLKRPLNVERMILDKQLFLQQQEEIWNCAKMLEEIAPEECQPDLLQVW